MWSSPVIPAGPPRHDPGAGPRESDESRRPLRIRRNTSLNIAGHLVPMAVAILAIPILVRELGTERFGILSLVLVTIGYFGLFDLGLSRALTQVIAREVEAERLRELPSTVWTAMAVALGIGSIGAVVVAALAPVIVTDVFRIPTALTGEATNAVYALALCLPIVASSAGLQGILAAHHRFGLINAVSIPMGVLGLLGPVAAAAFTNDLAVAVLAIVVARFAGWAAYAVICARIYPLPRRGERWNRSALSPLLRFGGWLTITNVVGPIMVYADRFMIGAMLSMTAVSYYAAPYDVVTRMWVVPAALLAVLYPAFARSASVDRAETAKLVRLGVSAVFQILFPVTLVLVTFAPEALDLWLGPDFAMNSTRIVRWLAAGVFLNCLAQVPFVALQGIGRPDVAAKVHVLELPLYLATFWWCVANWGLEGAAIAWVIRVAVDTVVLFGLSLRWVPIGPRAVGTGVAMVVAAVATFGYAATLTGLPVKAAFIGVGLSSYAAFLIHRLRRRGQGTSLTAVLTRGAA